MKSSNLLFSATIKFFLFSLLLLFSFHSYGQVCATVTLTTQAQVNAFSCTSINGDLIINDGGTGNITDLNPIWTTLHGPGATISGRLIVSNCPNIPSLYGLDGIVSIGNRFEIGNCPNITTLNHNNFPFQLTNIGEFLYIHDSPKLTNISALSALTTLGSGISIAFQVPVSDFNVFNNVTSSRVIEIINLSSTTINGFANLTSCEYLNISGCQNLTSISGFEKLQSIKQGTWNGIYNILNNPNLSSVSGHPNLNTVNAVTITNNPKLASCCFMLPILDNNPSSISISGNAAGCKNVGQIDSAPQLSACPPNRTVSTGSGNCLGSTSAISPIAMDNCDLSSYNLTLLSPDGSTTNVNNVPNGVSLTYSNLLQGISKVTFKATDARNNSSDCSFNITVKDNEKPILSNIPPNVTIHCNDNFPTIPSPIINDNCDGSPALTAASSLAIGNCTLGAPAEIHSYSWTATDESGNESTANWEVTVISDFSFNLGAPIEICDASNYIIDPGNIGESYAWSTGASSQAISVSSSGTYKVTITSKNGCCYESEKTVAFSSPPDATAMGATLNCEATEVQIFGSSTASGASYSWTGPGGFMSDMQNPMVSSLGEYILTVTNAAGCGSTASALVIGDTDIPDVSAEGGTINCETTSIQLMGSSASSGVTFSWTGPDGFTSDMQNPTVSTPGNYILNVQSGNGCSGSADALVIDDTSPPEIILSEGILSCAQSEIELSVEGEASWTGPDGFTSSDETIVVSTPGTYSVTVTGSNSCTNSETVEILSDLSVPDISAEGGIINCVSGQTTLSGNSTTEGATYSWTGPGDFTTEIQNPIAIIAGTYTLIVTGPNGCSSTMAVEVSADMDAPEVSVNDGSVDCVNTSTELTASTTSENITFIWSGPNGFTADGESITVSEPGEYLVMAVNENGCAGSATSTVAANNIIPTVSIFVGPIGCQTTDVTFATEVSEGVTTYSWTGPNNFTSNEKEPVITEIGTYTLNVTSENGCTSMASFDVISDSEVPDANATVDGLLTCTQNTITLMGNTSTDTVSFFWTGPDDFTSTLQNPTVSQPGVYMLSVIAANGCAGQSSVEVMGDGEFPTVNATGGDINCNNSSVILLGTTNIENATFRWEGPNGFATSISNPEVEIAGEYTFTVTSEGGCVAFKTVTVNIDNQDPNLSLSEGFLDCNAGVRNFRVVTNAQDPTILWTGPDNYSSTELNAPYSQAGIYSLSVTGSNGCSSQLSIEVDHDIAYVHTLNITGNDASLEIEGGTPPFIITWDNDIEGSEVSDLADGEHFVKIVDGLDCTKFVEFTISTSSVTDLEKALELKIYPNPVVDQLKIEWVTTDFEPKNLEIINANGRKLQRTDIAGKNNQVVDMSDLTPGIYFVRMEGKDSVIYKKFLKM